MKRQILLLSFCITVAGMFSCQQPDPANKRSGQSVPESQSTQDPVDDYHGQPISVLDPRVSGTDSMVFVFYTDPYTKDSLRYTRYYTSYHSKDTNHLSVLMKALQDDTERFSKPKPCRNEGKIWCFREGTVLQTIYFSTRQPGCHFIYFIKNGQFYFSSLPSSLEVLLGSLKKLAVEEPNQGKD